MLEVHVDQALISAIERDASLCHGNQSMVVAHIGCENHDTGVGDIRPSNVWRSREGVGQVEEFIRGTISKHIGVEVYDL